MSRDKNSRFFICELIDSAIVSGDGNEVIDTSPSGADFGMVVVRDNGQSVTLRMKRWARAFTENEATYLYSVLATYIKRKNEFATYSLWHRDGRNLYFSLYRKVYLEIIDKCTVARTYGKQDKLPLSD